MQVAEVTELRGTTSRQDAEVRHLRDENRDLAQKAALVEVLSADSASLKQQASAHMLRKAAYHHDVPGGCGQSLFV